jgi:hypothetical protein
MRVRPNSTRPLDTEGRARFTSANDHYGVLVGLLKGEGSMTPLMDVIASRKTLDLKLLEVARILAQSRSVIAASHSTLSPAGPQTVHR